MAMEVELGQAAQKVFTDSDVVRAVLDGDRDAFSLLVERYQKGLATYIFHMIHHYDEALELTQEVFIKVYENLNRYDGQYKFSTWLYKIASNHTIDHIRRQHMTTMPIQETAEDGTSMEIPLESATLNPLDAYTNKAILEDVQRAVDDLPPDYRELIILRHFSYRSYEEMAKITGLPLGTVKNRIFRARQILMEKLQDFR
jgi:RNA polymerase sigma-70 factor, ECF subfamily